MTRFETIVEMKDKVGQDPATIAFFEECAKELVYDVLNKVLIDHSDYVIRDEQVMDTINEVLIDKLI